MAPRTVYANLVDGLQPFSLWDQSLADMGSLGIIPCTAAGTNAIVLTPIAAANAPAPSYANNNQFFFISAGASTGPVTVNISGLSATKNVYKSDGVTHVGSGDIFSSRPYEIVYSQSLNAGAGGFYLKSEATSAADLTFTQAGTGSVARSLSGKVGEIVSVTDFGAVGDWVLGVGGTDNGPAFSAAIAAAVQTGKRVHVPAGKYLIGSAVTAAEGFWLEGEGWEEEPNPGDGTWLIVQDTSFTPFALSGVATRGTRFEDIAFFQTQPDTALPGWTPNPYPPFISMTNALGGLDIADCFVPNVTKFVSSVNSGRLYMRRVKAQVYNYLAEVDQCFDVPMFDDIHVWPFNTSADAVLQYQQANCDAFRFMRVDGPMLGKIFVFGARSAIHMFDSASGHVTKLTCNALTSDFVKNAVWVESASATGSFGIIEGEHEAWPSTGAAIVGSSTFRIDGNDCHFNVWSLRSDRVSTAAIELTGGGNQVQVGSLRVGQGTVAVPQALYLANVGVGNANVVNLATPPFLEGVTALSNSSTNGVVGYGAFSQGLGQVGLNFSYDSGGNRMLFQPAGSSNVATQFYGDGTGHVGLGVSGNRIFRVDRDANGDSQVLLRSHLASVGVVLESGSTNADIIVAAKGTGRFQLNSKVLFAATATTAASFNIPQGTAPSSPVDGDVWREDNTNTGLKVRINGVTKTITVT